MRATFKLIIIIFLLTTVMVLPQTVVLNEVMPVNLSTLADEDAEFPDWLELYNSENVTINLSGYGLSDDLNDPFKWRLPALALAPADFLVIFASDKDRDQVYFWNSVINRGDEWAYQRGDAEPPSHWNTIEQEFDDSGWQVGRSGFGYGDDDDETIVQNILSIYVRKFIQS